MREHLNIGGRLTMRLRDPATGAMVLERRVDNLVTLAGRALLAELLTGAVGFAQMELAVGGPPDPADHGYQTPEARLTDVALAHELQVVPVATEPAQQQLDGDGAPQRMVAQISGTLDAELGGEKLVMTEAGIKITRQDSNVVLYNRVVFDRITKEPNLQMTLTWEVMF
jgi:hypothetical protein